MTIDKQNGNVAFSEEEHLYWDVDTKEKFISVTTIIGQYHEKFNEYFWSRYKAFESLCDTDAFKLEKKNLLTNKVWNDVLLERYDIDVDEFNEVVQNNLDHYETERAAGCERGNKYHLEQENKFYTKQNHNLPQFGLQGEFFCEKNYFKLDKEKGIYPEFLISRTSEDGILKLAGQVDLIIKDGNDIHIIDYKTNKKIEQKGFFDTTTRKSKTMYYPVNNIIDTNYWHYTLQLSMYAWMVEKMNPELNIKSLTIIHKDHTDKITTYQLEYLKNDVIRLLKHYKKQREIELDKIKNTPINF